MRHLKDAAFQIFKEAGMERILRKQYLLTGYLECLLKKHLSPESGRELTLKIITPEDPKQRGSQLSLVFSKEVSDVHKKLEKRAIVVRDHFCLNNFTPLNQYDFLLTFQSDLKQVVVRCIVCLCNPPNPYSNRKYVPFSATTVTRTSSGSPRRPSTIPSRMSGSSWSCSKASQARRIK